MVEVGEKVKVLWSGVCLGEIVHRLHLKLRASEPCLQLATYQHAVAAKQHVLHIILIATTSYQEPEMDRCFQLCPSLLERRASLSTKEENEASHHLQVGREPKKGSALTQC